MPACCSSSARSATWNASSFCRSRCRLPGRMRFQNCRYQAMACSLSGVADHARHSFGEAAPALFFLLEAFSAGRGKGIETRLAILFGLAPLGLDPTLLL